MKKLVWLFLISIVCIGMMTGKASAAEKKVGVLIGDERGTYTWYDLNATESDVKNTIRYSANNTVMMPAYKVTSLMDNITYSYNSKTKKVTITNTTNGRKIVGTVNKTEIMCYTKTNTKGTKKTMPCRIYIAKGNGIMIPADTLKYVMYSGGYEYYEKEFVRGMGYDTVTYDGIYMYNSKATSGQLPLATKVKGLASTVRVTIPEGYSLPQIFDLLVNKGVCETTASLYDVSQNYDYSYYPQIAKLSENTNRCFRLEGYLFPDTYEFNRLSKPEDAIGKFLRNTESKITDEIEQAAEQMGWSVNELLTLASLIEKECNKSTQRTMISAVFYNRMYSNMKLQTDAASYYVERYVKPNITGDVDRYNAYYNTYKCVALPAGPICNPGMNAIKAALHPAQSEALFFCSDKDGNYYFNETYEEHLAVLAKIKEEETNEDVEE